MNADNNKKIISAFYKLYNAGNFEQLFELVADDVVHQFNFDEKIHGIEAFKDIIMTNSKHYDEKIESVDYMSNEDGSKITTKFIVNGLYKVTDSSGIPASNQMYTLTVFNYIEIKNGKIVKGHSLFDENEFQKQVSA